MNHYISSNPLISKLNIRQYFDRRYLGEFWAVTTNLLTPIANLAAMMIIMKFVRPEDFGTFQTVFLAMSYFHFIPLGVFNGLRRNIAFYNGQGNFQLVRRQVATSMFVSHVTAALGVLTGSIVFLHYWLSEASNLTLLCSLALILNLAMYSYNTHYAATFSGYKDFKILGNINAVRNIITLGGALFPIFVGAIGLALRNILSTASVLLVRLFSIKRDNSIKASFDFPAYTDLVKTGFPIMLSGYLNDLLVVADRSVVAAFLNAEDLGYYALAGYLMGAAVLIPQSFSLVLYPKAAEAFGKTCNPKVLRKYMFISLFVNVVTMVPMGLCCYYFLDELIIRFFPNYAEGIRCAQIACFTVILLSYSGVNITFMVLKRNAIYQAALTTGFLLIWVFGYLAIKNGYGVEGVAIVRAFATMLVALTTIVYAVYLTNKRN